MFLVFGNISGFPTCLHTELSVLYWTLVPGILLLLALYVKTDFFFSSSNPIWVTTVRRQLGFGVQVESVCVWGWGMATISSLLEHLYLWQGWLWWFLSGNQSLHSPT